MHLASISLTVWDEKRYFKTNDGISLKFLSFSKQFVVFPLGKMSFC